MNYCKECLQPDTRPNTVFQKGICPACNYFKKFKEVDWDERKEILFDLVEKYRNPSAQYDCIIGVSGGKDSLRQAIWIRDYLKLRPLLVSIQYPPHQLTNIGANNLSNLIKREFDVFQICPSPIIWKRLMKTGFKMFGNWAKSTELALFSGVPRLAIDLKIPLILWGENPGLQRGDLKTLGKTGYDGNNLRNMNTLSGGDYSWMLQSGFSEKDIIPYMYPSKKEMVKNDIQIVYLGWFLGDWSLKNNGMISILNGLSIRDDSPINTSDLFQTSALDEDWVVVNQLIKYLKFGFGKTTDYVNEMIRLGEISRDEAIEIVEKYDGMCSDKYIDEFCEYIEISKNEFWSTVRKFSNTDLFKINRKSNNISSKFKVGVGIL